MSTTCSTGFSRVSRTKYLRPLCPETSLSRRSTLFNGWASPMTWQTYPRVIKNSSCATKVRIGPFPNHRRLFAHTRRLTLCFIYLRVSPLDRRRRQRIARDRVRNVSRRGTCFPIITFRLPDRPDYHDCPARLQATVYVIQVTNITTD
jgi:hypothetical protein